MNFNITKSISMKKLFVGFLAISILICLGSINSVKAANLNGTPENSVITIRDIGSYTNANEISPQNVVIDNSVLKMDISASSLGPITGSWKYTSKIGNVTFVNLTMSLEYRKNFLDSWEEVGSVDFFYVGGLGLIEENEHTFREETTAVGSYRLKFNGTITGTDGLSKIINRVSKTVTGGGSMYTRFEEAS